MIITNFTSAPIIIKGLILQPGANIVKDDIFTEEDRSAEIGLGTIDLLHYYDVQTFLNSKFFTNDSRIFRIEKMINDIESNKELLKAQAINKQTSFTIYVNKNIITTSRQIKAQIARVIKIIDSLKRETLNNDDLVELESLYNNITEDEHQEFNITKYAKKAYAEIKETRKQALPYDIARIRTAYAR